jgi:hypothetical protein
MPAAETTKRALYTWPAAIAAVAFVWLVRCGGEEAFVPPAVPEEPGALSGVPAGEGGVTFSAEASVGVSAGDLSFLREQSPQTADDTLAAEAALRRVLAMEAVKAGLGRDPSVVRAYWRALAQVLLKQKFEVEHTPDTVPMSTWEDIYWEGGVRPLFDHFDTYFVLDMQVICCFGSLSVCAGDVAAQACLRDSEAKTWEIYEQLSARPYADADEVTAAATRLKAEKYPDLSVRPYSFQYNFAVSHEKQRGYTVINRNVALAARDTPPGTISKPTRSNHGWHILYVKEHLPEAHGTPADPDVIAKMKEKFYAPIRDRDVAQYLQSLVMRHPVSLYEEEIRGLDWERLTGIR